MTKTISASQIKLWNSCQRAWGYRYLEGKKSPQTDSQRLGTRVHEILEEWLTKGEVPDPDEVLVTDRGVKYPGKIARAGLPLLPPPFSGIECEKEFTLEVDGVFFYGFIDFLTMYIVGDHKTTTDFKWAMSLEELEEDVQAIIYAKYFFDKRPTFGTVKLQWTYFRTTKEPDARKVEIAVTRQEIEDKIHAKVLPPAREILRAKNIEDLELNPGHCSAYGGCPHQEYCRVTPKERFMSAMNVADFIKQQQKESPVSSVPEVPAAPEYTAANSAAPPGVPEVPPVPEYIAANGTDPTVLEAPTVPKVPEPAFDPEDLNTWSRDQLKAKAVELGLVDESSRLREKGLLDLLQKHMAAVEQAKDLMATIEFKPEGEASVPTVMEAYQQAKEDTKPLSDYQESLLPPVDCTDCCADRLVTIGTDPLPGSTVCVSVTHAPKIHNLYIDCVPSDDAVALSQVIADALKTMDYSGDYRLEPDNDYGKAAGVLSDAVAAELEKYPDGLHLTCSSRLTEHQHCLTMLEGKAARIVRGGV